MFFYVDQSDPVLGKGATMYSKHLLCLSVVALSFLMSAGVMAKHESFEFEFPEGIEDCDPNAPSPNPDGKPLASDKVADATPCKVSIADAYLTQMSVGKAVAQCKMVKVEDEVDDILDGYETKKKDKIQALNDYLWEKGKTQRKVPLIIGLDGRFYITDHHHLSWSVWDYADSQGISDDDKNDIILQGVIAANWRDKAATAELLPDFWNAMENAGKAWFYDEDGEPMPSSVKEKPRGGFPKNFGKMKNDVFRSISRWEREACLYLKDGKDQCSGSTFAGPDGKTNLQLSDFMEFRWGNYLRNVVETTWDEDDRPSARDLENPKKLTKIFNKLVPSMFDDDAINEYFNAQPGWEDAEKYGLNTSLGENYWKLAFDDETADGDQLKCEIAPDLKSNK
jgi:hypothetical protein